MSYEQRHPTLAERDHVTVGAGNRITTHIFCTTSIVTCPLHRQMHEKCASIDGVRKIKINSRFGSCSGGKKICLTAEPVVYGSGKLTGEVQPIKNISALMIHRNIHKTSLLIQCCTVSSKPGTSIVVSRTKFSSILHFPNSAKRLVH
jgi:hypothetical protein